MCTSPVAMFLLGGTHNGYDQRKDIQGGGVRVIGSFKRWTICIALLAVIFLASAMTGTAQASVLPDAAPYPLIMEFTTTLEPGDWEGHVLGPSSLDRAYLVEVDPLLPGAAGDFIEAPVVQPEYNGVQWNDVVRLIIPENQPSMPVRVRVYDVSSLPVVMDFTAALEPGVWHGWPVGSAAEDQGYIVEITPIEPSTEGAHVERHRVTPELSLDVLRVMMSTGQPTIDVNLRVRAITSWPVAQEFTVTLEPGERYQFPIGPSEASAAYVTEFTMDGVFTEVTRFGIRPTYDDGQWIDTLDLDVRGLPGDTADEYHFRIWQLPTEELPNVLANPDFENGTGPWKFHTNGRGTFTTVPDAYNGQFAAAVQIVEEGSNVQLYQSGIELEPNQLYRLHFAAYSSNGADLSVYLHKHGEPYTNYGLRDYQVNLQTGWYSDTVDFVTTGFSDPIDDARLRFWLAPYDEAGATYRIDHVLLYKVADGDPLPDDGVPIPVSVPLPGHCDQAVGNVVKNPGFEDDKDNWRFYTNGKGSFGFDGDAYECEQSAQIAITQSGDNVQVYQKNVALEPEMTYRLRLAARASEGQDVKLFLHKHGSPYTNYGLNGVELDLTPDWQVFVIQFTTTGFDDPVSDGRLRLWLAPFDEAGTTFWFDDVVLQSAVLAEDGETLPTVNAANMVSTGVLVSGYFLDTDDEGLIKGATVPEEEPRLFLPAIRDD